MPDGFLIAMFHEFGRRWLKTLFSSDFQGMHDDGECNRNCPWCVDERFDLGGEG